VSKASETVLVIVGAGPRTVGLLERIAANGALLGREQLAVHVIDPYPAGAGRVWRQHQSPLLLLNSRAADVTMFTDAATSCAGPVRPGPTFFEWCHTPDAARLADPGLAAEAASLTPYSWGSRRLLGRYLEWCFRQAVAALPASARVLVHQTRAVALAPGPRHALTLGDGTILHADIVILAQGRLGGRVTEQHQEYASLAAAGQATYAPPAYPGDAALDRLPAGEPVIVSGLGLNFIDITTLLTQGRGGRFERDRAGRLRYRASGREPVLHAGSRRGVPYLPKPEQRLAGLPTAPPRFFTATSVESIMNGSPDFGPDLVACAVRELMWAYYRELFTGHPELTACPWPEFAERFAATPVTDPALRLLIESMVPDPRDRLDLEVRGPLSGLTFPHPAELDGWMRRRIAATMVGAISPRHSPNAALLEALIDVGDVLLGAILAPGAPPARLGGFPRLVVYRGSGPPPHRLEELAALSAAGVVRFLGAGLRVECDRASGVYTAVSDSLRTGIAARHLVEARLPGTDIRSGDDPLLAGLGATQPVLEVDPLTYQVLDSAGSPVRGLLAMGAFASGGAIGALSRPCRDEPFFRENDKVARRVLASAQRA
jgi:hypothetical protein